MTRFLAIALTALTLAACSSLPLVGKKDSAAESSPKGLAGLNGTWQVTLHNGLAEQPATTTLVISGAEGGTVEGSFYDTPFSIARATTWDGRVVFTGVTQDGSGPYAHSATLEGTVLEGQTLSVGRDFIMAWTAERVSE